MGIHRNIHEVIAANRHCACAWPVFYLYKKNVVAGHTNARVMVKHVITNFINRAARVYSGKANIKGFERIIIYAAMHSLIKLQPKTLT